MTAKPPPEPAADEDDLMTVLEKGVRETVKAKKATFSEKNAAMAVGVKVLMVRHHITGGDEKNFFDK